MNKNVRRGLKWIDRATGPTLARARTEEILEPTTRRLQAALAPVSPSSSFDRQLRQSLEERARAMRARQTWYRTRGALAGAAAIGVGVGVAGIATVVAMRRRQASLTSQFQPGA